MLNVDLGGLEIESVLGHVGLDMWALSRSMGVCHTPVLIP